MSEVIVTKLRSRNESRSLRLHTSPKRMSSLRWANSGANSPSWVNLMFPEVEKKCVVDSFRKQETQKNHNRHFSEWLAESDADYSKAHELYDKLKKEEEYKRIV